MASGVGRLWGRSLWMYLITMSHANKLSSGGAFPLGIAGCLENEEVTLLLDMFCREKDLFMECRGRGMDHGS